MGLSHMAEDCGLPPGLSVPLIAEIGKSYGTTRESDLTVSQASYGCGRLHRDRCCQPYRLLYAAFEGCKDCVRAAVEQDHVSPAALLATPGHNPASWALEGAIAGKKTLWVQGYLAGKGANASDGLIARKGTGFGCGRPHQAACSPYHNDDKYAFFSAAHDGCCLCVPAYIEQKHLDPRVQSQTGDFNALSWARTGAADGRDTNWVQGYLEAHGVTVPEAPLTANNIYLLLGKCLLLYHRMHEWLG
jgi:hypothetical protein